MMKRQPVFFVVSLSISVMLSSLTSRGDDKPDHGDGGTKLATTRLAEVVPAGAYWLFQTPSRQPLKGAVPVDESLPGPANAKQQSMAWVRAVMAEGFLPKDETVSLIPNEFEQRDVVRIEWQREGYRFRVAQTGNIFTLWIARGDGGNLGGTPTEQAETAKQLCEKIFASDGTTVGYDSAGDPVRVSIKGLSQKVTFWSFPPQGYRLLAGDAAIHGSPRSMKSVGVSVPLDDQAAQNEMKAANADWDQTASSWSHWLHQVNWWNDGKSVGFYFLKMEGVEARNISYDAETDQNWFRLTPKDRGRNSKRRLP